MDKNSIAFCQWDDIKEVISKLNPEFAQIIDSLSPGKDLKLVRLSYTYGDHIICDGKFQLPGDQSNNLTSLCYANIPMFMIVENNVELFIDNGIIVPLNILSPGTILGLYETANYLLNKPLNSKWSVIAGARTIFTLDKLSDTKRYITLCRDLNLPIRPRKPTSLFDHWSLFKEIANSKTDSSAKWSASIIAFPKQWFEYQNDKSLKWLKFYSYLFAQTWASVNFALARLNLDIIWGDIATILAKTKIKTSPFIIDTVKQLIGVSQGHFPGFISSDDEQCAPMNVIQDCLINVYQIRDYYPSIMHISPPNKPSPQNPIYYSLSYPTLLSGTPYDGLQKSIMVNLKTIKYIFDRIKPDEMKIPTQFSFRYYHLSEDIDDTILPSQFIFEEDSRFHNFDTDKYKFCYASQFWKGCIKIT